MKITVAICAAVLLAACSSPYATRLSAMPAAPLDVFAKQTGAIKLTGYYPVPSFGPVDIYGLTNGPGHTVWFTEFQGNAIGNITTAGVATAWATAANAQPYGIAMTRSHKRLWTGGYGGIMIGSTAAGVQTDHPIAGAHIGSVLRGPDKNIWFTDYGNDKIGRLSPSGVATEFALPPGAVPDAMASGPDGNLWIADLGNRKIIKESLAGVALASYGKGISPGETVNGIVAGPDGNLYFSEYAGSFSVPDKIGRITTKGKIVEIGTLPPDSFPNVLAVGKDKNVYFAISHLQAVGKIVLATGKVSYHYLPLTSDMGTNAIVNGPDDRLYLSGGYTIYAVSY
jgi:streptogramin lyase